MTEARCCICKSQIDADTAPILVMGGAGTPRCLCEECDSAIVRATKGTDPELITEACGELGERLKNGESNDMRVIKTVGDLILEARDRRDRIAEGTYDFALDDEPADGDDFDITEDLEETEEDRALDEREAKVNKIVDTVTTWVMGLAIVAAAVFLVIKFVF